MTIVGLSSTRKRNSHSCMQQVDTLQPGQTFQTCVCFKLPWGVNLHRPTAFYTHQVVLRQRVDKLPYSSLVLGSRIWGQKMGLKARNGRVRPGCLFVVEKVRVVRYLYTPFQVRAHSFPGAENNSASPNCFGAQVWRTCSTIAVWRAPREARRTTTGSRKT